MMKPVTTAVLLAFLSSIGLTSPLSSREAPSIPSRFTITAARSASPVHLQPVHASGRAFWIGKETATLCPLQVSQCPPGYSTVLEILDESVSLDVSVPGGQRVYVAPGGALEFAQAHSASIPAGSAQEGFKITPGDGSFASFGFSELGATGFLACPAGENGSAPYQIFADVAGLNDADVPGRFVQNCIGFNALAVPYTAAGSAAWQYT